MCAMIPTGTRIYGIYGQYMYHGTYRHQDTWYLRTVHLYRYQCILSLTVDLYICQSLFIQYSQDF